MEINEIKLTGKPIPEINIFDSGIPQVFTGYPVPVTVNLGFPVVDIPGCVESRETDDLREVDPRGNMTFCDGQVPSFNPPNFEPNQMLPTQRPNVDTRQPKPPAAPDLPIPQTPPATAKIDCPTAAQQAKEPVGTYIEGFRKKVTDYQLVGNQCIQITEKVSIPEQIIAGLPSPGSVVMTGGIAVIATTSALMAKPLADILLKVVKPTVKKVMKKIAAIRGKSVPVLSVADRQAEQRIRSHAIRKLKGKE
jgi:hypothetical protein